MRKLSCLLLSSYFLVPGFVLADDTSNNASSPAAAPSVTPTTAPAAAPTSNSVQASSTDACQADSNKADSDKTDKGGKWNDLTTTHPPTPQYTIGGLTLSGYAAGSYNYLSRLSTFSSGVNDRLFDLNPNGFTLQQAAITATVAPTEGWGFLLNPLLGRDANTTVSYGMTPLFDSQNLALDLVQAYLSFTHKSLTVIGGKYQSIVGYESFFTVYNENFSNSFIDQFAEPGTVTGLRATYAATDKLNLILGVDDGWDNIRDWSRRKTIEAGLAYSDPKWTLSAGMYNGEERATPLTDTGPVGVRTLIDLVATVNATDKLTLAANFDYATQNTVVLPSGALGRAEWTGLAAYLLYQFTDQWRMALRSDYFMDPNGFATGVPQSLREFTATLGYKMFKYFELRAEARKDISNANSFQYKSGDSLSNNMYSLALEGIVTF